MDLIPNILNNSSIKDFSNSYNIFNSYSEINEGNDSSYEGYLRTDNFNFPNFNEISKTEGPTNNITNEERYNIQIPQRRNKITFNITSTQLGRKRKSDTSKRGHTKFSDDNIIRKIKHLVIKRVQDLVNKILKSLLNGNIGHNYLKKEFLILNKKLKSNATVETNKAFLNKSIGDILSVKISSKYTNFAEDHNQKLVEFLKNDNNLNMKFNFKKFFDLTFLQCLQHYRGTQYFDELNGMICFNEEKKNIKDEKDQYIEILENYVNNYEKIINKKRVRKPVKNADKNKGKK